MSWDGALIIDKPEGLTSNGVLDVLKKQLRDSYGFKSRKTQPKLGHGGTLDPFATGLLVVLCGRAAKLARYFLGSVKTYEGTLHFGQTTVPGDPTDPISETSDHLPETQNQIQEMALTFTGAPYLQIPPMHSAKKVEGRPLYELARQGKTIEREPKTCHIYDFQIQGYQTPMAPFKVRCSSGTYIRTLAQDLGKKLGTVAMLDSLKRTASGPFVLNRGMTLDEISQQAKDGVKWDEMAAWIPFDRILEGYQRIEASGEEVDELFRGRQQVLFNILRRKPTLSGELLGDDHGFTVIYHRDRMVAVVRHQNPGWALERVFHPGQRD